MSNLQFLFGSIDFFLMTCFQVTKLREQLSKVLKEGPGALSEEERAAILSIPSSTPAISAPPIIEGGIPPPPPPPIPHHPQQSLLCFCRISGG